MVFRSVLFLCLLISGTVAAEWDLRFKAELAIEARQFESDSSALTEDTGSALLGRLDTSLRRGPWKFAARGFARVDPMDNDRDLTSVEELFVSFEKSGWRLRAGYQMLNWTATEAFHPADVVNSRNLDSNIENAEKLGELMFSLRRRVANGSLEAFVMPRRERPQLPGPKSRLSFAPAGVRVAAQWLGNDGQPESTNWDMQWGARWAAVIGDADVAIHYLDHQDRQQPVIRVGDVVGQVWAAYLPVRDWGGTYAQVLGGSIVKLELGHKDFKTEGLPDHTQVALGYEYGWVLGSGAQATMIAEAQNYFGVDESQRAQLGIFQRDLLLGYRHAFNDSQSREILLTAIGDLERNHEYLVNLKFSQRLGETFTLELGLRWIDAPAKDIQPQGLELLDGANQVFVNLRRFF